MISTPLLVNARLMEHRSLEHHCGSELNCGIRWVAEQNLSAGGLAWIQGRPGSDDLHCWHSADGAGGIDDACALWQAGERHRDWPAKRAIGVIRDRERRAIGLAGAAISKSGGSDRVRR